MIENKICDLLAYQDDCHFTSYKRLKETGIQFTDYTVPDGRLPVNE
jgi:hypothetical protein